MNKLFGLKALPARWCVSMATLAFGAAGAALTVHAAEDGRFPEVGNNLPALTLEGTGGKTAALDWKARAPAATLIFFFEPRSAESFRGLSFADMLARRGRDFGLEVYAVEASVSEAPSVLAGDDPEEEFRSNLVTGDTYFNNWQFAKALPHYLRCLELELASIPIPEKIAEIHERLGDLERALEAWRQILRLDTTHPVALMRGGALEGP